MYKLYIYPAILLTIALKVIMVFGDEFEYRLVRDLMVKYDKRIRPSRNASDALNVTFGLALAQIIDVDEKNQILTTNCWLNQAWIDENLKWDPGKYDNIKVVRLPHSDIWKPDVLLYNNADVSSYMSSISTNVMVSHDGNVTWLSMIIFKSSCMIDVKYFPFDEQKCNMLFASWTYDGYQLNLTMNSHKGDISNYIESSEWDLLNLEVQRHVVFYSCCLEPYPDITFYIRIRRRPLFYVFNMVLPCVLITLVALLGFYIPSDSGEKVTMGITTLLSMTVFMMLVAENMPPTSDDLPLIGLYYGITICIVSFATGFTVLTLNIHHKGVRGREVPEYVKKICFGFLAKILCLRLDLPDTPTTTTFTPGYMDKSKSYMKFKMAGHGDLETGCSRASRQDFNTVKESSFGRMADTKLDGEARAENGGINARFTHLLNPPSTNGPMAENFERQFMRVLQKVYQTIERNEMRLVDSDRRDAIKQEWQQVALVVDRLLLWCFVLVTLTLTLAIMLQAPYSADNIDEAAASEAQRTETGL
ncbi:neuronal acetylcholine receptor subunit alpha-10-like [Liolophura sinensis]|uniref:neuronal acetylcholine receptor subunit alpha-10-like n=1 Tax=Liolophura sinensis TaxID=3198878 RepID=UPI003158C2F7